LNHLANPVHPVQKPQGGIEAIGGKPSIPRRNGSRTTSKRIAGHPDAAKCRRGNKILHRWIIVQTRALEMSCRRRVIDASDMILYKGRHWLAEGLLQGNPFNKPKSP
jgi:hypothetical protein